MIGHLLSYNLKDKGHPVVMINVSFFILFPKVILGSYRGSVTDRVVAGYAQVWYVVTVSGHMMCYT